MDIPVLRPSPRPLIDAPPEIYSVQLNEQFIIASFYQDAEVCIWDAATKNLVNIILLKPKFKIKINFRHVLNHQLGILDADFIVPGQESSFASSIRSAIICLDGNILFTIHEV